MYHIREVVFDVPHVPFVVVATTVGVTHCTGICLNMRSKTTSSPALYVMQPHVMTSLFLHECHQTYDERKTNNGRAFAVAQYNNRLWPHAGAPDTGLVLCTVLPTFKGKRTGI